MKKSFIFLFVTHLFLFGQIDRFLGDINGDNSIDVLDIVLLVNFIISDVEPTIEEFSSADVNFDYTLDVLDIVNLVGMILNPAVCPDTFEYCTNAPSQCCDINHPEAYTDCETCHILDYFNTTTPPHVEQYFSHTDCKFCHVATSWLDITFNHTIQDTACNVCHLANMVEANNLVNQHNTLPSQCNNCHTTADWVNLIFPHDIAGFPLIGAHESLTCMVCHADSWLGVASECTQCHLETWQQTTQPIHEIQVYNSNSCDRCHDANAWIPSIFQHELPDQAACYGCHATENLLADNSISGHNTFPNDCSICHETTLQWQVSTFDHNFTNFPLIDSHVGPVCAACHSNGNYQNTSMNCDGCHYDTWLLTTLPDHGAQTYRAEDCEICHNATAWNTSIFEHGLPEQAACNSCHNADFEIAGTTIAGHATFPTDCTTCHQSTLWTEIIFDHNNTGFPLTDSHDGPECIACHVDNNYQNTPTYCDGCHHDTWLTTTLPDHGAQTYLAEDCEMCHNSIAWDTSIFEHGLPNQAQCVTCHTADFEIASLNVPDHAGYSPICSTCHATTIWSDVTVDHSFFPLTGVHEPPVCEACHITSDQPPTTCEGCHLNDFNNATELHHFTSPTGGYPIDQCDVCHNLTNFGFTPDVFTHTLTSQACVNCHLYDFTTTTDPNHQTSGYSQTCDNCHASDTWQGADPHQAPLAPCQNCHNANGQDGDPLPTLDHDTAPKLGTAIDNCEICHTSTTNWSTISFGSNRHDGTTYQIYFEIYSGEHNGEWNNNCTTQCHVFGDFNTYSCYQSCHEHSQSEMLNEHCEGNCENCSGSNGHWNIGSITYTNGSWSSPNTFIQCYGCHPDGDKDGPCGDD